MSKEQNIKDMLGKISNDKKLLSEVSPTAVEVGQDLVFECYDCEEQFMSDAIVVRSANNISFAGVLGVKSYKKGNNTYYLHCPTCDKVHLFGFNLVNNKPSII